MHLQSGIREAALETYLVVESVDDVPQLERADEDHAVGDSAAERHILVAGTANVDQRPENEAGAKFVERLNVKGANAGVELASDEPVEEVVTSVAAESEELALGEGDKVAVEGLDQAVDERGGDQAGEVIIEEGEALRALVVDDTSGDGKGEDQGAEGVDLVVEATADAELRTLDPGARNDEPGKDGEGVPAKVDSIRGQVEEAVNDAAR